MKNKFSKLIMICGIACLGFMGTIVSVNAANSSAVIMDEYAGCCDIEYLLIKRNSYIESKGVGVGNRVSIVEEKLRKDPETKESWWRIVKLAIFYISTVFFLVATIILNKIKENR